MSCYDRRDWADFVDSGYPDLKGHEAEVYGLWRYEIRQVALPARGAGRWKGGAERPGLASASGFSCSATSSRTPSRATSTNAPRSRPFDEVEADCGGFPKFGA